MSGDSFAANPIARSRRSQPSSIETNLGASADKPIAVKNARSWIGICDANALSARSSFVFGVRGCLRRRQALLRRGLLHVSQAGNLPLSL
jgi:hypothetical protein